MQGCSTGRTAITWNGLVAVEPHLEGLRTIASFGGGPHNWATIKREMSYLVGWHAKDRRLSGSDCYDVAYRRLLTTFEDAGGRV